jgi:hypothetical protein
MARSMTPSRQSSSVRQDLALKSGGCFDTRAIGPRRSIWGQSRPAEYELVSGPDLFPIGDSRTAVVFNRSAPGFDRTWWDDVRSAALGRRSNPDGPRLWEHLAAVRTRDAGAAHLTTPRVLDRGMDARRGSRVRALLTVAAQSAWHGSAEGRGCAGVTGGASSPCPPFPMTTNEVC